MNYGEYLNSEHWRETRQQRLERDGHKCAICGSTKDLNVHHLTYIRIGKENIDTDLITVCHACHAMLHRVADRSKEDYLKLIEDLAKSPPHLHDSIRVPFWNKIRDLLAVEIWLRDQANGGDIRIWDSGGGMVGTLSRSIRYSYPDVKMPSTLNLTLEVKNILRLARSMKICQMHRAGYATAAIADVVMANTTNVQKVLKRHGFNATAKIT